MPHTWQNWSPKSLIMFRLAECWSLSPLFPSQLQPRLTAIVVFAQVSIKTIHIRYEDEDEKTKIPYALGVCMRELHAFTTDSDWNQVFVTDAPKIFKQLTIRDFFVYFNENSPHIENPNDLAAIFGWAYFPSLLSNALSY